jgi:hypothetical protein
VNEGQREEERRRHVFFNATRPNSVKIFLPPRRKPKRGVPLGARSARTWRGRARAHLRADARARRDELPALRPAETEPADALLVAKLTRGLLGLFRVLLALVLRETSQRPGAARATRTKRARRLRGRRLLLLLLEVVAVVAVLRVPSQLHEADAGREERHAEHRAGVAEGRSFSSSASRRRREGAFFARARDPGWARATTRARSNDLGETRVRFRRARTRARARARARRGAGRTRAREGLTVARESDGDPSRGNNAEVALERPTKTSFENHSYARAISSRPYAFLV